MEPHFTPKSMINRCHKHVKKVILVQYDLKKRIDTSFATHFEKNSSRRMKSVNRRMRADLIRLFPF